MLKDLDSTIEALLKEGLQDSEIIAEPADVSVSFAIPNSTWSAKSESKFTINCYLFDIHERRLLREEGRWFEENGGGAPKPSRRQPPLFFEMTYLITAWCEDVEDEHLLLWRMLETLMDHPVLPEQRLQGALKTHEWPIHTTVAQMEGVLKSPGEFWTALENQIKPSLTYTVTLGRQRRPIPTVPEIAPPIEQRTITLLESGGLQLDEVFSLPAGARRAGVTVQVKEHDGVQAITDAAGYFLLQGLTPNRYMLKAEIAGKAYSAEIDIQGESTRLRLSDVFELQDKLGLVGATVEVNGPNAITDANGRFRLQGLTPGRYTLETKVAGTAYSAEVDMQGESTRLRLSDVFELQDKLGLVDVTVEVKGPKAITDASGRFRLQGLTPGRYTLETKVAGKANSAEVDIQGESTRLRLSDVFELQDKLGLVDVTVQVEGHGGVHANTDASGHFLLQGLTAGRYTLKTEIAGTAYNAEIDIQGESTRLRLSDVFELQDKLGLVGATVEVKGPNAITDASGHFLLQWLTRGRYTLKTEIAGTAYSAEVDIQGESTRLRLSDVFELQDKLGLVGATVEIKRPNAITDASGRFRLQWLTRGRYTLNTEIAGTTYGAEVDIQGESIRLRLSDVFELQDKLGLVGATVEVKGPKAITDASGRFRLQGLTPGSYTLETKIAGQPYSADVDIRGEIIVLKNPNANIDGSNGAQR